MDQFLMQQLLLAAQQQPGVLAKMLAQTGAVPPPMEGMEGMGGMPGGMVPGAPEVPAMDPGTVPGIPASMPTVAMPEMAAPMPGVGQAPMGNPGGQPPGMANLMQMLGTAGKAAPASADTKPIMSGGIGSAQRLEPTKVQAGQSAMSADMIVKLLTGASQNPLRVPQLGQLMRG
ncbi:MAG: hypothetical protein IPK54_10125 [Dokdonella sp.]|uniref:hypothetical protein n=1 Tax=Dokdonella sp. TaxID=2291710 RepID=UPI0025B9547A|nr:hypothetical protein [Dokdonella sp.]MBK8123888.1 hypothetical protein [Dokdonella sp.]